MTYIGKVPQIRYKAVRITPTITGVQYANNDILIYLYGLSLMMYLI